MTGSVNKLSGPSSCRAQYGNIAWIHRLVVTHEHDLDGAVWLQQDRSVPLTYAQRVGTLIYDADCGFCTRSAQWLQQDDGIDIQAWQFIDDLDELGLNEQMVVEAAHWLENGTVVASGSDAIGRALIARGGIYNAVGQSIVAAPVRPFARGVYKVIARNRHKMPGGTAACRIPTN